MSTTTTHTETEKRSAERSRSKLVPALRFKEFEDSWEKKKIGDIAELTSSKRVYLNDYVDIGIPFYRGKEITELRAGRTPDDILYITESSYNEFKSKYGVPQKDDILITAVGTLGNVLRIKNDDKFYFKDGNLIWFRKIQESSNYLEIALECYKRAIDKTSIGSTQRALTMVELRKLKFPFPSLPEQQKIASFLSSVDQKIQQLTKKKELLEQYKKGIMQQLFPPKGGQAPALRFKDKNGNPYPNWEEKRLGDICEMTSSKRVYLSDYVANGIPFYRGKEISELRLNKTPSDVLYITEERYNDYKSKYGVPKKDDILVTAVGTLGNVLRIRNNDPFYFKDGNLIWLRKIVERSIYFEIILQWNTRELLKTAIGSTQKALTMVELRKLKFDFPCLEEQQKIATYLSSIDTQIEGVNNQITQTQTFKKGLLQQMFVAA